MRQVHTTISKCAEYLPEGWQIQITVERGSGWAELFNPDGGNVTPQCNLSGMDLSEQMEKLLSYARTASEIGLRERSAPQKEGR